MQNVAHRTGLSPYVIRAWENRYGAVKPARSAAGHRRYTERDVQRLMFLQRATRSGHRISSLAALPATQLRELIRRADSERPSDNRHDGGDPADISRNECIRAVRLLDEPALAAALEKALVRFGYQGLLRRIISRLAEQIGELWRKGTITAAHEHFFTSTARLFVGRLVQQFAIPTHAPALIAATPTGQHHELGAFIVAVAAMHLGWRSIYLGTSLPAAEIAGAVLQANAAVLVLSIVYPADDPNLAGELREIRKLLPGKAILVGGRAARSYGRVLTGIKARLVDEIVDLPDELDAFRAGQALNSRN
jgi:DNA-binding transcriptional MerR regulator/methylmalonyl-CoA mutase cobalamin-binding subunit